MGANFEFDKSWYEEVIASCCLYKDLNQLPDRDLTEIGEKGVNLSGGQRARIGLARAVYARKRFLLLDDVLAACDAKVAHAIFHNCILKLLKHNCVILVTHNKTYESYANICVEMKDGTVSTCFRNEKPSQVDPVELSMGKNGKVVVEKANDEDGTVQHVLVPEEERVKGKIGKGTFLKYLRSAGDGLVFFVAILLISAQIVSFGAEFTLKQWTESSVSHENTYYLVVFIALTLVAVIFGFEGFAILPCVFKGIDFDTQQCVFKRYILTINLLRPKSTRANTEQILF